MLDQRVLFYNSIKLFSHRICSSSLSEDNLLSVVLDLNQNDKPGVRRSDNEYQSGNTIALISIDRKKLSFCSRLLSFTYMEGIFENDFQMNFNLEI